MSDPVAERLRELIREHGPLRFDAFMREALYGDGGYYDRPPIGPSGDFVTSPHVHPVFSRLVGIALEERWRALAEPGPVRLIELGAGDGTMARELIAGFGRGGLGVDYTAVEVSAGARGSLADVVTRVVADLDDVPPIDPGLVVANELLDNLPFRRIRGREGASVEVRVTLDAGRFAEVETPIDDPRDVPPSASASDGEVVVPSGAFSLVDALARTLRRGYALLIDYVPSARVAPVRGYRAHRIVDDVLSRPGSSDITAGVDLDAVSVRARATGLVAFEHVDQRSALLALGFERWASDEITEQGRLLDVARGGDAVRVWEGRGRARLLVDPLGLGALRWCVLATPGLEEPPWLTHARELAQRDGDRAS